MDQNKPPGTTPADARTAFRVVGRTVQAKLQRLNEILDSMERVLVAFSGGVDSTFLLRAASDRLGATNVRAVIAVSPSLPASELEEARATATAIGVELLEVESREMDDPSYLANDPGRCYYCKAELSTRLLEVAEKIGFVSIVYGAIADDAADFRPGMKAASEAGVRAPLLEAGLSKADVRSQSRALGLPTWDKPAKACLSSRVPTGTPITAERLRQVEAAEEALLRLGFREVRVRHHGDVARIELGPADLERFFAEPSLRRQAGEGVHAAGFRHVTVDLDGYRQGRPHLALKAT